MSLCNKAELPRSARYQLLEQPQCPREKCRYCSATPPPLSVQNCTMSAIGVAPEARTTSERIGSFPIVAYTSGFAPWALECD